MDARIQCVTGGPLGVNTYVVGEKDGSTCVVIDPGAEAEQILEAMGERSVAAVLLTHAHFDHMLSAKTLLDMGAKLYVHKADAPALAKPSLNMSSIMDLWLALPDADVQLKEGDVVEEAGLRFDVLHTPGHTKGSVCYQMENVLFSGDTLFFHTCGRTDLPGGSMQEMRDSLARLLELPSETIAYPGHGAMTKIGWERGSIL